MTPNETIQKLDALIATNPDAITREDLLKIDESGEHYRSLNKLINARGWFSVGRVGIFKYNAERLGFNKAKKKQAAEQTQKKEGAEKKKELALATKTIVNTLIADSPQRISISVMKLAVEDIAALTRLRAALSHKGYYPEHINGDYIFDQERMKAEKARALEVCRKSRQRMATNAPIMPRAISGKVDKRPIDTNAFRASDFNNPIPAANKLLKEKGQYIDVETDKKGVNTYTLRTLDGKYIRTLPYLEAIKMSSERDFMAQTRYNSMGR